MNEIISIEVKYGGWRLKVYHWEEQTYPQFKTVKLQRLEAPKYFRKFARHFKVSCPALSTTVKQGGGHYQPSSWIARIALAKETHLGLVCHEFAHHLDAIRHPDTAQWHGKSFRRELKKVYTFAKRYLPEKAKATPPEVAPVH